MKTVGRYDGTTVRAGRAVLVLALAVRTVVPSYRLTAQETSLTIYTDARVVVRRTVPVTLAPGANTMIVDLGVRNVEPASIVSLDSGVSVRGVRVQAATGLDGSLRRALGLEVAFRTGPDTLEHYVYGTVLSVDPVAVRVDGNVMYGLPGKPVFPDSLVQLEPRIELSLESARAAGGLRLLYMSSGVSWSASYALVLPPGGAGSSVVSGTAQIDNGAALALRGAQVQLLAGAVRNAGMPRPRMMAGRVDAMAAAAAEVPSEEGLTGVHIYTLPGTVDFAPGETRTLALFAPATADAVPEYTLRGQNFGPMALWPDAIRDQHPDITYRVRRPATGPFGARPLPAGVLRVFEPDSAGRPQLVGEVSIDHTPAGRDLQFSTGTAFDITAVRTQTSYERRADRESLSGYRVDLQNARPRPVVVLVTDQCPGRCDIVASSVTGEQPSATAVGFRVTVPANGSASLTYQLRARW